MSSLAALEKGRLRSEPCQGFFFGGYPAYPGRVYEDPEFEKSEQSQTLQNQAPLSLLLILGCI